VPACFICCLIVAITKNKNYFASQAAKPSAPSWKGSGEEAPGIEPVHPSCRGVPIPPNSLYRWATEAFCYWERASGSYKPIVCRSSNHPTTHHPTSKYSSIHLQNEPASFPSLPASPLPGQPFNPPHPLQQEQMLNGYQLQS
jgi:hypothetical protein